MHVPLITLVDDPANVRRTGRGAEPMYVASIRAKGIIESLIVRPTPNGEQYRVTNGGKRLAALRFLRERGETANGVLVDDNYPVPVTVREEDRRSARDTSLITNTVRAGMHPVDEYEAFAELVAEGMPVAEVAARYALEEKAVRQRLALGQLSPKVREAWREGEIGAEQAQAFTLAPTIADQEKVFDKLRKNGELRWGQHRIREAFIGKQGDVGKLVAFVGADELRAAGVDLREDLFGTAHTVPDPKVVKKLADEKLAAECARLVADGWGWASVESDLPQGARWHWSALQPKKAKPIKAEAKRLAEIEARMDALAGEPADSEAADDENEALQREQEQIAANVAARSYSAEDKARSGCIVAIGHRGELEVKHAVLKPDEAKKEKAKERAKEKAKTGDTPGEAEPAGPNISNALAHDLSVKMTLAVREALRADHDVALAAMVAGFLAGDPYGDPIRVRNEGLGAKIPLRERESFAALFERFHAMRPGDVLVAAAAVAGDAVSLERHHAEQPPMSNAGVAAMINAIDPGRLADALKAQFDPEDFFKRASAKVAIAALVDIDGRNSCISKKKPDIAALVVEKARATGWLPLQMRTAHYSGPGAKWTPAALEDEGPAIDGFDDSEDGEE